MGLYFENKDKMGWLHNNGIQIPFDAEVTEKEVKVVAVDNGIFIAAAVAYSQEEYEYFINNPDERPKIWFKVQRELLRPHCPAWEDYMKPAKS